MPPEAPNPWIVLVSVIAGLIGGLFSGFLGRRLEERLFGPKLVVDFVPGEVGFRTEGSWTHEGAEIVELYIRARARNVGKHIARQCRPYLTKLERVFPAGTTERAPIFESLVLRWPGGDFAPRDIPPGIIQFFDVVGVLKSSPGWRIKFSENHSSLAELAQFQGTYRFTVLVTGEGARPAECAIDVTYNGNWHNFAAVTSPRSR